MGKVEEDNITVEIIGWIVLFMTYVFVCVCVYIYIQSPLFIFPDCCYLNSPYGSFSSYNKEAIVVIVSKPCVM